MPQNIFLIFIQLLFYELVLRFYNNADIFGNSDRIVTRTSLYQIVFTDYHTYVGMILVELHHRNPVVAVFCDTLLSSKGPTNFNVQFTTALTKETADQRHRRIQRRWHKVYTLINNPSIRPEVKSKTYDSTSDVVYVVAL